MIETTEHDELVKLVAESINPFLNDYRYVIAEDVLKGIETHIVEREQAAVKTAMRGLIGSLRSSLERYKADDRSRQAYENVIESMAMAIVLDDDAATTDTGEERTGGGES